MPDAENGSSPTTPVKTTSKGRGWARLISYIKRKVYKRRTKKQEESPVDRTARHTANATIWLAVFTVVLAVVSGLTLRILNGQLGEMQGSGKQTDKLICLYQKQAGDTHNLAVRTKELAQTSRGALV